jgi:hypothetical protein|tara:strand:- start:74 stop:511 length:438 start_codon:yes stop_codon:yes gene_type:complete
MVMAKGKEVKKIKKYIDEILNTKTSFTKKRPLKQDKIRKLFCTALNELAFVNARAIGMKHDYAIDFTEYDDPFFKTIDSLMKLHFSDRQRSMINWWLYDKFLPDGNMLVLNSEETGEEIPTETPEDIWELLQELERKENEEKNPN